MAKCWCDYPPSRCGNVCCRDVRKNGKWFPHRTTLYAVIHKTDDEPATVLSGKRIKFCPVCGKSLVDNPSL